MSRYLGDFALGQTVRGMFATGAAAGGRVDFSNALEAADVRVYKNGSATQRASEAGYTVTSGFDSLVGAHYFAIDTSDNTDAGFFVAGADYSVVLYPDETVDSQSVAAVLAEFSIENRFPHMQTPPSLSVGAIPLLGILDRDTAQAATGTTLQGRSASAVNANDVANGVTVAAFGSTQGYWQYRSATDYDGTTKTFTVDTWTVTPSGTITYIVFAGAPASASVLPSVNVSTITANAITASALATDAATEIANAVVEAEWTAAKSLSRTGTNGNGGLAITMPNTGAQTSTITVNASASPIVDFG